jgi:competence protein ComEC
VVFFDLTTALPAPGGLRRRLMWCAVAACVGLVLARHFGLPAQAALALLLVAARLWLRNRPAVQPWAIGLCLGSLLHQPGAHAPASPGPGSELLRIDATVAPDGQWDPKLREWRGTVHAEGGSLRLSWVRPDAPPLCGDRLLGWARMVRPMPALGPEDREQDQRTLRRGIVGTITARGSSLHRVPGPPGPLRLAEALRQRLIPALGERLGPRAGPLLCRLTLAAGPPLSDADQGAHAATGLAHLLAVSGFHAVLVAAMVERLLRLLRLPGALHTCATAMLLLFYALLTGLEPPVVRAVGALLLRDLAFQRGLPFDAATAMAVTTLITAALEPEDIGSASFLLSYAAVAGLLLWAPPLLRRGPRRGPWLVRAVWAALALSLAAFLATAPVTLWLFRQAAPWSILATPILTLPVAALIVAGFGLGAAGLWWPAAADLLAAPVERLSVLYLDTVGWFATLPGAPLHAALPVDHVLLPVAAVTAVFLLWRRPGRGAAAAACAVLAAVHFVPPGARAAELRLFPVGHGLSCFVRSGDGHTLLIDCGSLDRSRPDRLVVAALRRIAATRLDDVVATHADADHAGAMVPLLFACSVGRLWLPSHARLFDLARLAEHRGIEVRRLGPGATGQVRAGLLVHAPPFTPDEDSGNDAGLWLAGDLAGSRLLLLADQEEIGVAAVLARRDTVACDVLLAPHHGRPNALTPALLAAAQPDLVLVSDGWRFGTSPEELLYRKSGAVCLRTALCGEIALHPHPEAGLTVTTFLPPPTRPLLRGR